MKSGEARACFIHIVMFSADLKRQIMNEAKTEISRQQVEVDSLKKVAIFLEGVKQGRGGNLLPLGNNDLEQLWNAIAFLQGDERFECRDLRH
jgi:hypothetical protein